MTASNTSFERLRTGMTTLPSARPFPEDAQALFTALAGELKAIS
jgi:hypothetical protein